MNTADIYIPEAQDQHPPAKHGYVWSHCCKCERDFETKDIIFVTKGGPIHLKAGKCNPCHDLDMSKEQRDREALMDFVKFMESHGSYPASAWLEDLHKLHKKAAAALSATTAQERK